MTRHGKFSRSLVACVGIGAAACVAAVAWHATSPAAEPASSRTDAEVRALPEAADRHMLSGRFHAAIALMDRFERAVPRTTADFEGAYATALGNAALEPRVERGLPIPVTRSSIERVAMLRVALGRVAAGEGKSAQPSQTRDLRVVRAGMLGIWGFVRESYYEYWNAHDAQPLGQKEAGQAAWLEGRFQDPASETYVPAPATRPGGR